MSNFMMDPNADIYQMLAQQNLAASRGGGGGYGGGGDSLQDRIALMREEARLNAQQETVRAGRSREELEALQGFNRQNMEFQQGLNERTQQFAVNLNRQAMEQMAKFQEDLLRRERDLNLQVAQADLESSAPLEELRNKLAQEKFDFHRRDDEAKAAIAQRDSRFGQEYNNKRNELKTLFESLGTYKNTLSSSFKPDASVGRWMTDLDKVGPGYTTSTWVASGLVGRPFESFSELFTGDRVSDQEISDFLGHGSLDPAQEATVNQMIGAAKQYQPLVDAITEGGTSEYGKEYMSNYGKVPGAGTAEADKYVSRFYADMVLGGLQNSGISLAGGENSRVQMEQLMASLVNITRDQSIKGDDVPARVKPLLDKAAMEIFGTTEGTRAVPKLVLALQEAFNSAPKLEGAYASKVLPNGVINSDSLKSAAILHALQRGGKLNAALKSAMVGQVDFDNLSSVIGMTDPAALKNPITGEMDIGLLTGQTGEQLKALQTILGPEFMGTVGTQAEAVRGSKKSAAERAQEELAMELRQMQELQGATRKQQAGRIAARRRVEGPTKK